MIWTVTLIIVAGTCSVALKCDDVCYDCSIKSIHCDDTGIGLPAIVSLLPPYTHSFEYFPHDGELVDLGGVNFETLTELKALNISSGKASKAKILHIPSSKQNILTPLQKLQILKINIEWHFEHPLDDLFRPLVLLEELTYHKQDV